MPETAWAGNRTTLYKMCEPFTAETLLWPLAAPQWTQDQSGGPSAHRDARTGLLRRVRASVVAVEAEYHPLKVEKKGEGLENTGLGVL